MALTREQLDALEPPVGWAWDVRPTLRTSGTLKQDVAHKLSSNSLRTKFEALAAWAKETELGMKPIPASYQIVAGQYRDYAITTAFKVWANKPALWEATFAEYTCACGRTVLGPGKVYCNECGTAKCRSCGTGGTRMWFVVNANGSGKSYRCSACSDKCGTTGCRTRIEVNPSGSKLLCAECLPTFMCDICLQPDRPKEGLVETDQLRPYYGSVPGATATLGRVCAVCAIKYLCSECKKYSFSERFVAGKCALCQDKKDEEKRATLEVFPSDELPLGGSLLIKSLPSRPFRTISIETEVDGDGPYLARTLYRCGLVPISTVADYNAHPDTTTDFMAFLKYDGSVSGGEIISYLLNLDDPNHADSFMEVLKKLQSLYKMGKIDFTPNCGGHIHVDAHNYGYANVWRLLSGFGYAEDPIYRIAGAGSTSGHRTLDPSYGNHNRGVGYTNSPAKGPFGSKSVVGQKIRQMHRMSALNFQPYLHSIGNCACGAWYSEDSARCTCDLGKATIEWRVFNSTHNPRILHAWIALIQALHAWADEDQDPTPEWEDDYPALAWTGLPFKSTSEQHQAATKARLEWVHTHLPFTETERDSLCYAISKSDMGPVLGQDYVESLKGLPNVADFDKPKHARNPKRRQRKIKIAAPEPGKEGKFVGKKRPFSSEYARVTRVMNGNLPPGILDPRPPVPDSPPEPRRLRPRFRTSTGR